MRILGAFLAAAAAAPARADVVEVPGTVPFSAIPGWEAGTTLDVLQPILASCQRWAAMPATYALGGDGDIQTLGGTPAQWRTACTALNRVSQTLPPMPRPPRRMPRPRTAAFRALEEAKAQAVVQRNLALRDALETHFVAMPAGTGLLTAYFEPVLRGALGPGAPFSVPLYARPPELVDSPLPRGRRSWGALRDGRVEPMPDRAAIGAGALAGRGLEIAWIADPLDAFLLHIQGSGRILLGNGATMRLGYAGQNGHPFRSVSGRGGRTLREMISAAGGPEGANAILGGNPSYVFLRRVEGLRDDQGPIGALGVPLTPDRSVAVDREHVPLGAPVFIVPSEEGRPRNAPPPPAARLAVAQDTGGMIRGPARADLFTGWGSEAGARAMGVYHQTAMFVLLPRPAEGTLVASRTERTPPAAGPLP
ncbi:MltA domain-containing protein [Muricoccus radiodurans]|uniref:MltA domain-containing protein n=1 Tax=Muricoccus radiodurans TaxID=2231721 RepID=UPI003CF61E7F